MHEIIAWFDAIKGNVEGKFVSSVFIVLALWAVKWIICALLKKRITEPVSFFHWRKVIGYIVSIFGMLLVGRIWFKGVDSIVTFMGLTSAGLAIAMHDTIANLTGWVFILWRKPFSIGDRVQIGDLKGDVIDVRIFEFSIIEVGNWVDAEQSTGRIVHVPNSKILREHLANYETGFKYIWHEIPVLITFESDWEKAKRILSRIARQKAEHLSEGAESQIRRAAIKYLIYFDKLTPIVYTTVKESGVLLTIRYIVMPRRRRGSEQDIWEAILAEFAQEPDIDLAYPTMRIHKQVKDQ